MEKYYYYYYYYYYYLRENWQVGMYATHVLFRTSESQRNLF
jgi:hypothetical protein